MKNKFIYVLSFSFFVPLSLFGIKNEFFYEYKKYLDFNLYATKSFELFLYVVSALPKPRINFNLNKNASTIKSVLFI